MINSGKLSPVDENVPTVKVSGRTLKILFSQFLGVVLHEWIDTTTATQSMPRTETRWHLYSY